MKKRLLFILCLVLFATVNGAAFAEQNDFNPDALKDSYLYQYDRFENTWSMLALAEFNDDNTHIGFSFGTNSTMASMQQPFMFRIVVNHQKETCIPTAITFFLDDIRYDYKQLQFMDSGAIANSGNVMRDMLNRLKDAKQIAFRIYFTYNGQNAHVDVETDNQPYKDMIEVAGQFEEANAWSVFSGTVSMETLDESNEAARTPALDMEAQTAEMPEEKPENKTSWETSAEEAQDYAAILSARDLKGMSEAELNNLLADIKAELAARKAVLESGKALEDAELQELYQKVVMRLSLIRNGDLVYDEDGIAISWVGIKEAFGGMYKAGFICANNTGSDYQMKITNVLINGIGFPPGSNTSAVSLENGGSYYTASESSFLISGIKDTGISNVFEIGLEVSLWAADADTRDEPLRVIKVRFPVDEEIPQ